MTWPSGGQWEAAIGGAILLPLLFFELYRLRRSQRRDREKALGSAEADPLRDVAGGNRNDPPTAGTRRSDGS